MFAVIDQVPITWKWLFIIYPTITLILFNIGIGLILSALYVLFADTQYLYSIFLTLLSYLSGIFYQVTAFPENVQKLFFLNPVYCHIYYLRQAILHAAIPSLGMHALLLLYAAAALACGILVYKKMDKQFIYYL